MGDKSTYNSFLELGPDQVLNCVEKAYGARLNNLFRPLNSYINRVFELETEAGERLIGKFYRPGRWSAAAIADEHRFLLELKEQELPVIAPMVLADGATTGTCGDNFIFALFPKCGGRSVDEFTDEQWIQLGRLIGRVHMVGEVHRAEHRIIMDPRQSTAKQLEYLLGTAKMDQDLKGRFEHVISGIIDDIAPLFAKTPPIRIHGDCHFANIIHRPDENFYIIDFDDMAMGPPVQDIWMILPGPPEDSFVELDLFLEGYEAFRLFDRRSLQLIEPLRAMRFIHYMAWCVHQVEADGYTRVMDDFGSREYWQNELNDLEDQRQRIADNRPLSGNM